MFPPYISCLDQHYGILRQGACDEVSLQVDKPLKNRQNIQAYPTNGKDKEKDKAKGEARDWE